jgi:hypothetical protein
MKQSQNIRLCRATLIESKAVIPAKAGIQASSLRKQGTSIFRTGFPRIRYPVSSTGQAKAGLVKSDADLCEESLRPGMTNWLKLSSPSIILTLIASSILLGIRLMGTMTAHSQPIGKMSISRESGRDPFALPLGIRLLSKLPKEDTNSLAKGTASSRAIPKAEIKSMDIPLKVTAILVSDHIQLASVNGYIVTVGDSVHDEKVLEIKNDRVVMGKGDNRRTLLLSQSPVQLTVEGK